MARRLNYQKLTIRDKAHFQGTDTALTPGQRKQNWLKFRAQIKKKTGKLHLQYR
jgi:hypothetical protein